MIDKTIKLHLACGSDELRPTMQYVKVTKEVMVATNAHILAVVPTANFFDEEFIQGIPEDGMLIHKDDWKKMLQYEYDTWKQEGRVIKCIHSKKRPLLIEVEFELENGLEKFPNWEAVIPNDYGEHHIDFIGIDMRLAYDLQQSLGLLNSRLDFSQKNRAIKMSSVKNESDAYGIIMPVMID